MSGEAALLEEIADVFAGGGALGPVEVDVLLPKVVDVGVVFGVEPV